MTREEFVKQAKEYGYTDKQIKDAIDGMLELKNDFGIDIDYDGIVIHKLAKQKEGGKFEWQDGDVVIYQPKTKK